MSAMGAELIPATDAALDAVALALSAAPVDLAGIADHPGCTLNPPRWWTGCGLHGTTGSKRWPRLVVNVDGEAVGYMSARIQDGSWAETFAVIARPAQGRGIGLAARRLLLGESATLGVAQVVSLARPRSASAASSRRLGYQFRGRELCTHPDGYQVELEKYELRL